ncbi:hypothetical protein ES708_09299 [subsurface metagenome]
MVIIRFTILTEWTFDYGCFMPDAFFVLLVVLWVATIVYMTVRAERKVQKFIHMILHLIAITLGIIGIYAVFKFLNESGTSNMYSLHSWLGIITFCLYGLQVILFCCVYVLLRNILTLLSRIGHSWKIVLIRQSELPDQWPRNGPVGSF